MVIIQDHLFQTDNVFDGEWHHMVYTYASGTGKLYLDGVLRNTRKF